MAVSNPDRGVSRGTEPAHPAPGADGGEAGLAQDFVATAATVGVIAAGAALFEAALIPGMVIGGAAVLAPRVLSRLRRGLQPLLESGRKQGGAAALPSQVPASRWPPWSRGHTVAGEDDHLSDHRHHPRLHLELRGARRIRHGGRVVGLCPGRRPGVLFRPRDRLELLPARPRGRNRVNISLPLRRSDAEPRRTPAGSSSAA